MAENQAKSSQEKPYRERYDLGKRIRDFNQMKRKYPDRIPVIIERLPGERQLPPLRQIKFPLCYETTMLELTQMLRSILELTSTQAIFLRANNAMVSNSLTIEEVYNSHMADDSFLHITYASQETFG